MSRSKNRVVRLPRAVRRAFPNVTSIVDSKDSIEVDVNEKDCGRGAKRMDPEGCAMARALKREYKADGAIIGISNSYLIKGHRAVRFKTPTTVAREIVSFDRHHDFAPGEYKLSPISPSAKLGAERHRRDNGRAHPSGRGRIVHRGSVRVRKLSVGRDR